MANTPTEILAEATDYYSKLFELEQTTPNHNILKLAPKLSHTDSTSIDSPITLEEINEAISALGHHKTPALDGLTSEFYRKFKNLLSPILLKYFSALQGQATLPNRLCKGIITLIPKGKNNLDRITNWRPITMLCTDYKILSAIFTSRIQSVAATIINPDQTGFLKNRYILENALTFNYVAEHSSNQPYSTHAAVLLDFFKAFDSVSRNFLLDMLQAYNFGPYITNFIKLMHNNSTASLIINNHIGPTFSVDKGVRQGDPIAGLLFVLAIEFLANLIRSKLPGITIHQFRNFLSLYADDIIVYLRSKQDLPELITLLTDFHKCSGLRTNLNKSFLLPFGSLDWSSSPIPTTNSTKYLGFIISANGASITWDTILSKSIKSLLFGKYYPLESLPAQIFSSHMP